MVSKIFTTLIALALSATINLAELESGQDIYAKGEDSIQAETLTIIDGDTETEITEFPYALNTLAEKDYDIKSGDKIFKLHIDNTAPVITTNIENKTYQSVNAEINVQDAEKYTILLNGAEQDSSFTVDQNGEYTLKVSAEDKAGNVASIERVFTIYNTAPVIEILGCEKEIQNSNYDIIINTSSDMPIETTITLDGEQTESPITVSSEGVHTLVVTAEDSVGNRSSETRTFEIDKSVPEVTIEGIDQTIYNTDVTYKVIGADDIKLNGQTVEAEGTISDEGYYVLKASATNRAGTTNEVSKKFQIKKSAPNLTVKGLESSYYNKDVEYDISSDDGIVEVKINNALSEPQGKLTEEGIYVFEVTATDSAGNTSTYIREIVIDKTAPKIEVTGVEDRHYKEDIEYQVTATDDFTVTLDGKETEPGKVTSEGDHVLIVRSEDEAGNVTTKKIQFTIDKTPPEITITGAENEYYNTDVTFEVHSTDPYKVSVDGTESTSKTITTEGEHTIVVTSEDQAGNTSTKETKFIIDKTAPVITVTGVANGYYNKDVTYSVTSTDDFTVKLDGNVTDPGTVSKEGGHRIEVISADKAGNKSSKIINFTIDKTPPVITYNKIKYVTDLRQVKADIKDANLTSVSMKAVCKDKSLSSSGTDATIRLSKDDSAAAEDDTWIFTVTAIDKAGNKTVQKKSIVRDTISPKISFAEIKKYNNKNVNMIAYIADPNESESVMTITKDGKSYDKSGLVKISEVLSQEGEYEISVTSHDKSGNTSSAKTSFVIDKTRPRVYLHSSEGHVKSADEVRVSSNESGTTHLKVILDGKVVFDRQGSSYSAFSKNGVYEVSAYSIDLAGNRSETKTKSFVVDNTPPIVNLTGAEEGKYYNRPVTLTASVKERFYDGTTVDVTGTIEKAGSISIPFTCSGETTNISKTFSENGIYHIKMSASDKAGNTASTSELSFIIDTVMPEITIDVPDNSGYDAVVAPVVKIQDEFFDSKSIVLTNADEKYYEDNFGKTGGTRAYTDFRRLKENDGIYTITASATDLAGNESSVSKTFIVNRFGSVFKTIKKPSEYSIEADSDIVIKETNISGIKEYKCFVLKDAIEQPAKDVKVQKKENDTSYTIPKSNFTDEGVYKVYVETIDSTGNTSRSEADFSFTVDKTPPVITYKGIESKTTYKSDTVRIDLSATDSLSKDVELKVTANGKNVPVQTDDNGSYAEIGSGYNQNIVITATDQAGNTSKVELEKVSITTDKLAVIVTHKVLSVVIGLLAALLALILVFLKRRKKESNDDIDF